MGIEPTPWGLRGMRSPQCATTAAALAIGIILIFLKIKPLFVPFRYNVIVKGFSGVKISMAKAVAIVVRTNVNVH